MICTADRISLQQGLFVWIGTRRWMDLRRRKGRITLEWKLYLTDTILDPGYLLNIFQLDWNLRSQHFLNLDVLLRLRNRNFNASTVINMQSRGDVASIVCLWVCLVFFRISGICKSCVIDDNTFFPQHVEKVLCIQCLDLITACLSTQKSIGYILRYVAAERIWVLVLCGRVQVQHGSHRIKAQLLAVLLDCWCLCAVLLSSLTSLAALCVLLGSLTGLALCFQDTQHQTDESSPDLPHMGASADAGLAWDVGRFGVGSWKNNSCPHHALSFQTVADEP